MDGVVLRKQKIIVESEIFLSPDDMDFIKEDIEKQLKTTGIVILPPYLKVTTIDSDQLIIKEDKE